MSIFNPTDAAKALITPDPSMLMRLEHQDGSPAGRTTMTGLAAFLGITLPTTATAYTLAPSNLSDPVGSATSYALTPIGGTWPAGVVLTPAATGVSGTFNPTTLTPSGTAGAAFSFMPSAAGSGTISVTSSPAMTNPAGVGLTVTATVTPGAGSHALLATSSSTGAATTPGMAAMTPSALMDVRVSINTPSYASPGAVGSLMARFSGGPGFLLYLDGSGIPGLVWHNNGTFQNIKATAAISVAVNTNVEVRAVVNISTSANGSVPAQTLQFFTSVDNESTYQQVGANVNVSPSGTFDGPDPSIPLTVGGIPSNLPPAGIEFRRARLLADGTSVVDIDFSNAAPGASTVTASTGQVFTIVGPGVIQ